MHDDVNRHENTTTSSTWTQVPDVVERGGENLLDAGLRAAKRGWKIFPCNTKKIPLCQWRDVATTDPTIITEWSKWRLVSMWGRALPPEVLVTDLDRKHGLNGVREFERLQGCRLDQFIAPQVITGTAGVHVYTDPTGRDFKNSASAIAPGVDTRTIGGYVIIPSGDGFYRWLTDPDLPLPSAPQWTEKVLRRNSDFGSGAEAKSFKGGSPFGDAILAGACEAIECAKDGEQEETLNARSLIVGHYVGGGLLEKSDAIQKLITAGLRMTNYDERNKWTAEYITKKVTWAIEDGMLEPQDGEDTPKPNAIHATPYVFTAPSLLKPRHYLYKPGYVRKYTSMTIATTKVGKSSKSIVEALAMVTGRSLLGILPIAPSRVWYWNGEDPRDEIDKRVAAACKHYEITEADIGGRLFIDSGRDMPIKIPEIGRNGATVAVPVVKGVIDALIESKTDMFIADPFVSTHGVPENDNSAMQQVAEQWAFIADTTNSSVRLSHHTRKTYGEAVDFESQRGASSTYAAVRYAEVLNYMTEKEAKDAGINPARRKFYFREDFESNLFPPSADNAVWYEKVSVDLENAADGFESDKIGVVVQWEYPQADNTDITLAQQGAIRVALREREAWRADPQAKDWVGVPIAKVLGVDLNLKAMRKRVKGIIDKLEAWGDLHPVTMKVNRVDKEGYTARPLQEGLGL